MAPRTVTSWLGRLRFAVAHPPWLLLASGLLILAAGFVHLVVLPGLERQIEAAEQDLRHIERANRRAQFERRHAPGEPDNIRSGLLDQFPDDGRLLAELGRLLELANNLGLQLPTGDYQLASGKDKLFDRYVLNLPVQGSYRDLRQYITKLRVAFPTLAIEDISLRRNNIGQTQLDAQLRLVMFVRSREAK